MGNFYQKNFSLQKKVTLNSHDVNDLVLITNNYIITNPEGKVLDIFDLKKNLTKKLKNNSSKYTIKFHPKFENVLLLIDGILAKIIEITKDTFELKEKIIVKGHTQPIMIAEFSKTDDEKFVTYSSDNTIKIWNIKNPFCLCNISVCNLIVDIQLYNNFIFYYDKDESKLIKYNYDEFKFIKTLKVEGKKPKFIILNEENFALINGGYLKIVKNYAIEKYKKLRENFNYIFYDEKLELFYIFSEYDFDILDDKLNLIYTQEINEKGQTIFFSNKIQEENLYANFFLVTYGDVQIYSLYSNNNISKKKFIQSLYPEDTFWKKIVPSIADIGNLQWEANLEEEKIKEKEYLKIKRISGAVDDNYSKSLNIKRLEVSNELKSKDFDCSDYISILNLLIKDNTNKKLIIKYLKFLQNLEKNKIKLIYKTESFENEYEKYKIMFRDDELKAEEFDGKSSKEKDVFINLLERIKSFDYKDKDKLETFKNDVEYTLKNLQLFNQPIDLSNDELYWYRNTFVVYFSLKKILKDENKIKLMKESIKTILDKKLLDKDYILESNVLLTSILILIAIPQSSQNFQFNINLIESKDPNYDYKKEPKFQNLIINTQNNKIGYFFEYNSNDYFLKEPSTINLCFNNFILNIEQDMKLEEFEQKNYDTIKEYFKEIIDYAKMKQFLAKIFCSKVIRQAFDILYPEHFNFPFENENDCFEFLKQYYYFIPFKTDKTGAITEKFSLEIYYILQRRLYYIPGNNSKEINILVKKIYYRGLCVKSSCHEINHEFYNLLLMHSNGQIPVETPRKKYIEEREGGKNMERLLFDKPVGKLSLKECLYLLNEKNYEKNLQDFKDGFSELKDEDIMLEKDCIFYELNEVFKAENLKEISSKGFMKCDEGDDNSNIFTDGFIDGDENVNDVLGFIRDPTK